MNVTFVADIALTQAEIDEAGSRAQAIQNRIGSSGAVVVNIMNVES